MALVKEDGTGVTGANTYALVADLTSYAALRGITLPALDAQKETLLILAMDAIESLEETFIGDRTYIDADALTWPRTDPATDDGSITLANGTILTDETIPPQLIAAQCQLACDLQADEYFTVANGQAVIEETVGPITTKYASPTDGGGSGSSVIFQKFEAILSILQRASATQLRTVRV